MPNVTVIDEEGQPLRASAEGDEAEDLLWAAGVACGRWPEPERTVSALPQLVHARALLHLQQRFGSRLTQRRMYDHRRPWSEPRDEHLHDEPEIRVVLAGCLRVSLRCPALGGYLQARVLPLEWLVLPAHLPHAAAPDGAPALDMLCLHTQAGGWRAHATGAGSMPGLGTLHMASEIRAGTRVHAVVRGHARSPQPELAAA